MLIIEKIPDYKKNQTLPAKVKTIISQYKDEIMDVFRSVGMFDICDTDYLIVIGKQEFPEEIECKGFVYNGTEEWASEWGVFGLNLSETKRIW